MNVEMLCRLSSGKKRMGMTGWGTITLWSFRQFICLSQQGSWALIDVLSEQESFELLRVRPR